MVGVKSLISHQWHKTMEDTRLFFECEGCGAEYSLHTDMDIKAEFCPFCGEPLEEVDWEYDDENVKRQSEGT